MISMEVSTVAGTGEQGHDYRGGNVGKNQPLSSPWDVVLHQHIQNEKTIPVLLIAMAGLHQIWALFLETTIWWKKRQYEAGTCIAIVGNGREANRNNCYPHAASLAQPSGLTLDTTKNLLFFADSESSSIRKVHLEDGKVSRLCGANTNPTNLHEFGDIDGREQAAKLQHPLGVAYDTSESVVYIADTYNHKIKKVDMLGDCVTVYGAGKPSLDHMFDEPSGLATNPAGNVLYIADTNKHRILSINLKNNSLTTLNISLPLDTAGVNHVYSFATDISTKNSSLTVLLDVKFTCNMKLNADAPQQWYLNLPEKWTTGTLTGDLGSSISMNIPEGELGTKFNIILKIMTCQYDECIPKKLNVCFNVNRRSSAASEMTLNKILKID